MTHRFLDDSSPEKRRRLVDELLDGSGYVVNFTRYWRRAMLPETESDLQTRFLVPGFEAWLRDKLAANTPYDAVVREIINTPLESQDMRNFYARSQGASPLAFYQAKQIAPENLAAATSRMFLGVRIECAQCHDHPFDKWKRDRVLVLCRLLRRHHPRAAGRFHRPRARDYRSPRDEHSRHGPGCAGGLPRRQRAAVAIQGRPARDAGQLDHVA